MQEIKTEIIIKATPEKVWSILTDIAKWKDWSPIIKDSAGTVAVGETVQITMCGKNHDSQGPRYSPKILELKPTQLFKWRATMLAGFLFTNDKVFQLEKTDTGTKLIHKELFSGLLVPIFCGQMEKGVPPMLHSMNEALKKLAETAE